MCNFSTLKQQHSNVLIMYLFCHWIHSFIDSLLGAIEVSCCWEKGQWWHKSYYKIVHLIKAVSLFSLLALFYFFKLLNHVVLIKVQFIFAKIFLKCMQTDTETELCPTSCPQTECPCGTGRAAQTWAQTHWPCTGSRPVYEQNLHKRLIGWVWLWLTPASGRQLPPHI